MPEDAGNKTVTWTSSDTSIATVNATTGEVVALKEGVVDITATSNEKNDLTATCNVTVTPPPPPIAGAGASTHTAKQITYSWGELNQIAKVISDNYGTSGGKISNSTAEVNVTIKGKSYKLGIGDYITLNGKKVRILGFNHDILANKSVYGGTNTYAGISFEFVDYIIKSVIMNTGTSAGGWGVSKVRSTLNNTTINSLTNKSYIKQVSKKYIKTYNNAGSVTTSNDKLWLLSTAEIWGSRQRAVTTEGSRYKFYSAGGNVKKMSNDWWLRSPDREFTNTFCCVRSTTCGYHPVGGEYYVAPGFCI